MRIHSYFRHRPMTKNCFGSDYIDPSIILKSKESNKLKPILIHEKCFLDTIKQYGNNKNKGICASCGIVFI